MNGTADGTRGAVALPAGDVATAMAADGDAGTAIMERAQILGAALDTAGLGIWEWDFATGLLRWSPELERLFGLMPGTFDGTVETYRSLVHADDRDAVGRVLAEALSGRRHQAEHRVTLPDTGETRWIECRGTVVRNGRGRVTGMTGFALDVTQRKRHEERLRTEKRVVEALHDVSAALGREHDPAALARAIVEAATRLTDASFGALITPAGHVESWAATADSGRSGELRSLVATIPARTGVSDARRIDDLRDRDGRQVARLAEAGVRSLLAVDMVNPHGIRVGTVVVVHPERAHFDRHHEDLVNGLAVHAAIALENAHLHEASRVEIASRQAALEQRDRVATLLQQSLLPPELPAIAGVDLAARYLPMTEGIGGDFYDVFPLGRHSWGLAVGDVCGKGPDAASTTALARYTIRTAAMTQPRPAGALRVLNTALMARQGDVDGRFCTALFARLEARPAAVRLHLAVAGHPPLLVLRSNGTVEAHGPTGQLLGVLDTIDLDDVTVDLADGDVCVFYTDGATDIRHGGRTFGDDQLLDVVAGCRGMTADAVASCIQDAVVTFQEGQVRDDLAIVVLAVPAVTVP